MQGKVWRGCICSNMPEEFMNRCGKMLFSLVCCYGSDARLILLVKPRTGGATVDLLNSPSTGIPGVHSHACPSGGKPWNGLSDGPNMSNSLLEFRKSLKRKTMKDHTANWLKMFCVFCVVCDHLRFWMLQERQEWSLSFCRLLGWLLIVTFDLKPFLFISAFL